MKHPPFTRALVPAITALLLAGCASLSEDGGFRSVEQLTRERVGAAPVYQRTAEPGEAAKARVAELLGQPLTADGAVELALINHRGLQAQFAQLGIAEADLVRAGRLANPSFSYGRLSGGGRVEIDRAVMFDIVGLLTLPLAREAEQGRFEHAQLQAAQAAVDVATQARSRWFEAVAAQQLADYHAQVMDAADASSELIKRMHAVGNVSKLAQLREQSFHADAMAQLARAKQQAAASRERLVRALGLADASALKLPDRLPDLPAQPVASQDAEQAAMERRLDVLASRRDTEATARSLGLTRATRFVNVLHAGYQNVSETGEPRRDGYEIELELPLFDFGSARVARAEAVYLQAMHRTAQVAVEARSEVREAWSAYRTAYELARHYRDEVVPLRQQISQENLLRYNGMLISVFDLLADAREQIQGVSGAVEALRDQWLAQAHLQAAMAGRPSGPAPGATASRNAARTAADH